MFGFIKYLQRLIEKLRKNKRVWFTTLFAISSIGITLSIVLLIMLTDSASKEVYVAQSSEYKLRHNNFTSNKLSEFRRLSSIALEDATLSTSIEQDDIGAITQSVQKLNTALAQKGFNDYQITYYSARNSVLNNIIASVIQTRNT
jgi:NADH:ubiquinone oxidoreductase subunit 5 (subunit L)/multisubunit Na+/H+ antiporter MnhA subunit